MMLETILSALVTMRDQVTRIVTGTLWGVFVFASLLISLLFSLVFGVDAVLQVVVVILVLGFAFRLAMEGKA